MKSTYELLSIHLDKKPIPKIKPILIAKSQIPMCSEISDEYNLLDLIANCRKISGLKILSYKSIEALSNIIQGITNCKKIVIVLDYSTRSQIACKLFLKRILQSVCLISNEYPEITFILSGDNIMWKKILATIYSINN